MLKVILTDKPAWKAHIMTNSEPRNHLICFRSKNNKNLRAP